MTSWRDDLGQPVELSRPARRVVSLVPSLTEAVAVSAPGLLVGATDWCTHPAGLAVTRVRGTKNPDRAAIISLAPDLVIANREENREFLWLGLSLIAAGANPLVGSENLAHNIDHFYNITEYSLGQLLDIAGFTGYKPFALKLYVFWKNPLNYVGLAATAFMEFVMRIIFMMYGKKVTILSKKIACIAYRPA